MKYLGTNYLPYIFLLLLTINFVNSEPKINSSIKVEDILGTQKCFDDKDQTNSGSNNDNTKMTIYEIKNNSTSNTIFIQYLSVKNFVVSESFNDDSSILHKDSAQSGIFYLNMNTGKSKYYVIIEKDSKPHKICFFSFPKKGNIFSPTKSNKNIKISSYELLSSSKLAYYIDNSDLSQSKIFYGIRFEEKILEKINKPKIEIEINFVNSERKSENFVINEWFLQNNYFYAPFYVPKLKFDEKFTDILIYLNIELKNENKNDEFFTFDLELIESQEITCEFNLNITSNKNNSIITPKIYFINIQKNIYENDRDILFLKKDIKNNYINPFFASNFNISNDNSALIDKDKNFIDITKRYLKSEKYKNVAKIDLFILILDEECNNIGDNDEVFISFKFFGGYHNLIHYQENNDIAKLFNEEKNKMVIKMDHCRTQYFINYFKTYNKTNDERILDIESAIGQMYLFHSNKIIGYNLDDYFNKINKLCIKKFENSVLSGEYNTLVASCPNLDPVMSYIYAHKKNNVDDIISFINQKSLIYIEYNNQYNFMFNSEEKNNEFEFRIKVLRTNIKGNYKIDITYESQAQSLENEKDFQVFKHTKNSNSNVTIKISTLSETETQNKGFILEIFKSIDTNENNIIYIEKEVEKSSLEMDKVILFLYDKNEVNSARSIIEFYNDNTNNRKVSICVHSGKGKHPFIINPICLDEKENIILNPNENLTLSYDNPYNNEKIDDENNQFYISILMDRAISYSYKYQREIDLDEDKYMDLNHKGNKIFKLSKKINQKKSIYYQINLCRNSYKDSKLYYTFNNSEPVLVKNDIYQEFSLDSIKTYLMEFNSETANQKGNFKYFYGPANLIKTINNFSKVIYISKNSEKDLFLIKFESPFTGLIDIKVILVSDCPDKYDDFCSLRQFCENYKKDNYNNTKIIDKKIRMRDNNENIIEINIDKKEINDFMNKNVDIYVISKSMENNLEIVYDVKSQVIDWYKLNKGDEEEIRENKNTICINCGLNGEKALNNNNEINNNDNNENKNNNNNHNRNDYNNYQNNQINRNPFNFGQFKYNNENNESTYKNNTNTYNNSNNYNNIIYNNDSSINNNYNNQFINNQRNNNIPYNPMNNNFNDNINIRGNNTYNYNDTINNITFINGTNITKEYNISNITNYNLIGKDYNQTEKAKEGTKRKKTRRLLYILLFIILIGILYYYISSCYNENVSYSKISKYSYYDF